MKRRRLRTAVAAVALAGTALVASATAASAAPAVSAAPFSGACGSGTYNWFHLYPTGGGEWCYGGVGDQGVNYWVTDAFCGGNNSGYIQGYAYDSSDGYYDLYRKQNFGPGTTKFVFAGKSKYPGGKLAVYEITITKWSGGDRCPQ